MRTTTCVSSRGDGQDRQDEDAKTAKKRVKEHSASGISHWMRLLTLSLTLLAACGGGGGSSGGSSSSVVAKGTRIIGIHVQPPQDNNYDAAIALA